MILWQFIVLMCFLAVCEWAAEVRDSKRNALLKQLMDHLGEIENRITPPSDLPTDIARAIYREGESRREYFLATGKDKP